MVQEGAGSAGLPAHALSRLPQDQRFTHPDGRAGPSILIHQSSCSRTMVAQRDHGRACVTPHHDKSSLCRAGSAARHGVAFEFLPTILKC